jgi:hypothetical protein
LLTLLVSLVGELCWSGDTKAFKPLVLVENTLELYKFTIVMQFYDNKNAFGGFILDVFLQNWLCSYFTLRSGFARTLPGFEI